jgi:hypothetical protein
MTDPVGAHGTHSPTVLYKYLPPDRIDILENMKICFSPPSKFNDTFDSHYLVPKSQGSTGKIVRTLLKNRLGIFCLTEQPNNHLMWVHYAKNHTGFVLGFDAPASFFREDRRALHKVVYQEGPDVFSEPDANVCLHKSIKWEYEQEWRCIREFQPSESRLMDIEPNLITHIIIGSQMEPWQITRIMQYTDGWEMKQVQFQRSYPLRSSWSFENRRKTMCVCDKCQGDGYLMNEYEPH